MPNIYKSRKFVAVFQPKGPPAPFGDPCVPQNPFLQNEPRSGRRPRRPEFFQPQQPRFCKTNPSVVDVHVDKNGAPSPKTRFCKTNPPPQPFTLRPTPFNPMQNPSSVPYFPSFSAGCPWCAMLPDFHNLLNFATKIHPRRQIFRA